jgi:hypothetical protein
MPAMVAEKWFHLSSCLIAMLLLDWYLCLDIVVLCVIIIITCQASVALCVITVCLAVVFSACCVCPMLPHRLFKH